MENERSYSGINRKQWKRFLRKILEMTGKDRIRNIEVITKLLLKIIDTIKEL